jgi:hypothetical protein
MTDGKKEGCLHNFSWRFRYAVDAVEDSDGGGGDSEESAKSLGGKNQPE